MTVERIELSEELSLALLNSENLPTQLVVRDHTYTPQRTVKAGKKGAIWQVTDENGLQRAAKLAIYRDYEDRSYLREVYLSGKLERYPEFTRLIDAEIVDIDLPEVGTQKFVCFIETWVDGLDLLAFLDDYKATVDSSLLLAYVEGMAAALNALQAEGLRHNDLHAGNVMLERPAPGSLRGEWTLKVVDMGSLKPRDVPTKKEKDDHRHFADQIVTIINTILSKKQLSASERYFVSECTHLVGSMLDEDESVALREPRQIRELFELAHSRVFSPRASEPPPLQTPFEYISAEHIADDRLLVDIFAKSCPWLDKVAGPNPCLVTGPRGCGKSTIFRWLSLKAHLHKPAGEFDQFRSPLPVSR